MSKNILIVGGGTGGHISPGIALYEKMSEDGSLNPIFLTGSNDMRFASFGDIDPDRLFTYEPPALTTNILKLPLFSVKFFKAMLKAMSILRKNRIDAVVGMGGYASAPALVAAKIKKIPIFLCEQNSVPGKVTVKMEVHAVKIFATFDESRKYLMSPSKFILAGNPIRNNILVDIPKEEAKKNFHLSHCQKIILVIGGSQGALRLNELVLGLKKKYHKDFKNIGVIWSTGDFSYEEYKERAKNEIDAGSVYISPYIKKVGRAYRACDLCISRSGSGVMMELAAAGVPSILIPYPYAADNHQEKNADAFVEAGAAVKISDKEATPENVAPVLFELLNNKSKLKNMSDCARRVAKPDAAEIIVRSIKTELIK
ncbi:MAG: UDP-N-acetylglucosamine--N-acetylmuramyl-(pentapeptide) pyrophosphoryl-undecaprenol N-acetylglucosamine transferase [Spirochaetes bacterium ADurb.Bin218]|jgi:UDP-N-acetylglucosamine--N-acetylmuramyl-(pentapeptide) pyrophosphoryl-undecaprenol N-acetylglucosamine transferase|nr:undecaprenyldiphospho-muramoylpentapeptide beta-N-acetylglucosaminyltransferase [Spirochaetota bacterium]OQA98362.1 MAG: UDP-N-acetylglucosamine--N-acetylmuramyl-(pentapeptide) pyrophosphoryl-undecaprenol N-acetylglucosamine transferase [Spirochaetes bacterium ADurb.Bin218]HOQ11259.1 undecaprenyldiphospho-muramoylpentapeptide beta-N-acetylglucosaminyltransferase [Spirochaetota bacterium]HOV08393.1 undecaprenyldiphospho-muramoylpentapeptide beta-N-acetylglucosaminyltransferase [Spirochaetota b